MNNHTKHTFKLMAMFAWSALGFKRGINSYEYYNKQQYEKYKIKSQSLYLEKVGWGIASAIIYLNPVTLCFILYREAYRLEVNLRSLEDEKKTDYYNYVLYY